MYKNLFLLSPFSYSLDKAFFEFIRFCNDNILWWLHRNGSNLWANPNIIAKTNNGKPRWQLEAEPHKFKLSVMKIYSRERKSSEGLQGKVLKETWAPRSIVPFVKDYQANESKINDIIGKDSISYSFLSIWNKIYWFEI